MTRKKSNKNIARGEDQTEFQMLGDQQANSISTPGKVTIFLVLAMLFLSLLHDKYTNISEDFSSPFDHMEPPTKQEESKRTWINVSCQEFYETFGISSSLTDLQKSDKFKFYKDKWVQWYVVVSNINETFGSLSMDIKCPANSIFDTVAVVYLPDSQRGKLLRYKNGDTITFAGQLDSWGEWFFPTLKNGYIVNAP